MLVEINKEENVFLSDTGWIEEEGTGVAEYKELLVCNKQIATYFVAILPMGNYNVGDTDLRLRHLNEDTTSTNHVGTEYYDYVRVQYTSGVLNLSTNAYVNQGIFIMGLDAQAVNFNLKTLQLNDRLAFLKYSVQVGEKFLYRILEVPNGTQNASEYIKYL